jgi:ubiquinone/menaquinone biosynthesis C-methylase UbiE
MEEVRYAFWVVGVSCSGKSYYTKLLSEKLNLQYAHLDCAYDHFSENCDKVEAYKKALSHITSDVFIIDGIKPFMYTDDMDALKKTIGNVRIIYVLVSPSYEVYESNISKRLQESASTNGLTINSYVLENIKLGLLIKKCVTIETEADLEKITDEDIRSLRYQLVGHTDKKWQLLKIDCAGKSILDLGCSACFYDELSKKDGAKSYVGLDVNMAYLFNENARAFDINYIDRWRETADIVVCTSVLHYIKDKEKFIKECSRLANEMFVLETPLSMEKGLYLECDKNRHDLLFPTQELLEYWISKYFKSFECLGRSITQDDSYRLIYHCKK